MCVQAGALNHSWLPACPLSMLRPAAVVLLVQDVYVPRMLTTMCTRKVLVMEWVEGERLRTAYSAAREGGGDATAPGVSAAGGGVKALWRRYVWCGLL